MKFINKTTIEINRELSGLDTLALDFIAILQKHTEYVLVSGYVAILLGRARASEDIDIIIPKIRMSTFNKLYTDLKHHGFYCLNAEKASDVFEYLEENLAIRIARLGEIIPNIELKWEKHRFDRLALENTLNVKLQKHMIKISHLELQIAFKEEILKSPKDLEDATHIREVAKEYLDTSLIKKYTEMLHGFYRRK